MRSVTKGIFDQALTLPVDARVRLVETDVLYITQSEGKCYIGVATHGSLIEVTF